MDQPSTHGVNKLLQAGPEPWPEADTRPSEVTSFSWLPRRSCSHAMSQTKVSCSSSCVAVGRWTDRTDRDTRQATPDRHTTDSDTRQSVYCDDSHAAAPRTRLVPMLYPMPIGPRTSFIQGAVSPYGKGTTYLRDLDHRAGGCSGGWAQWRRGGGRAAVAARAAAAHSSTQ